MKTCNVKQTLLAVAVLSAVSLPAFAQDTLSTQPVRVTATRTEKELMDVNMDVSVITADQIKADMVQTVADLAKYLPGIEIQDSPQGLKRIGIHGEPSMRTLVLVDGQKIATHKVMHGDGAPMLIDPADIERIEIIKGPVSVLYGSDGIGGVVNIITKKQSRDTFKVSTGGSYDTGNHGFRSHVALSGKAGAFDYRLAGFLTDADGRRYADGERGADYFKTKGSSLYLAFNANENIRLGGTLEYYDLDMRIFSAAKIPKWDRTKVAAFYEQKNLTKNFSRLRVDAYYQKMDEDFSAFFYDANNLLDMAGFSAQTDWIIGQNHTLVAGYEFGMEKLDATNIYRGLNAWSHRPQNKDHFHKGTYLTHALYAAMESEVLRGVTLNYGARYTYAQTDLSEIRLANYLTDTVEDFDAMEGKQSISRLALNAGVLWRPREDLTLRFAWTQGFRSPMLMDRVFGDFDSDGELIEPNPTLKAETANNFELGLRWLTDRVSVDATLYHAIAKDYIASETFEYKVDDEIKEGTRMTNKDKATTSGLDLTASYLIGDTGFKPYVNFGWLRRVYKDDVRKTSKTGHPAFTASYGVKYDGSFGKFGVHADVFAKSYSKRQYWASTGSMFRPGPEVVKTESGFTVVNMKGGVDFGKNQRYSINAGVYNLFNSDRIAAGRHAMVKFNAVF